jgi:hypothetical protein
MITPTEATDKTIKNVATLFNAQYILIIDFEKTFIRINEEYKNDTAVKLVKLPKSSGVVSIDEMQKKALKNLSFKNYFNGKSGTLDTFEVALDLDEYKLYTTEIMKIPISALPRGAVEDLHKIIIKQVDPKIMPLQNRVIGVLDPVDLEGLDHVEGQFDILSMNSLCRSLIYVNYYDENKNQLIVNATSPEGIKSKYLIVGNLTYEKDI